MINSIEFVKKELNNLSKNFIGTKIRYEFIEDRNLHIVEVKPYDIYNDLSYLIAEEEIESKFEKLFPDERFLFLGEEPLYSITIETASFSAKNFKTLKSGITSQPNSVIPTSKIYTSLEGYTQGITGFELAA